MHTGGHPQLPLSTHHPFTMCLSQRGHGSAGGPPAAGACWAAHPGAASDLLAHPTCSPVSHFLAFCPCLQCGARWLCIAVKRCVHLLQLACCWCLSIHATFLACFCRCTSRRQGRRLSCPLSPRTGWRLGALLQVEGAASLASVGWLVVCQGTPSAPLPAVTALANLKVQAITLLSSTNNICLSSQRRAASGRAAAPNW